MVGGKVAVVIAIVAAVEFVIMSVVVVVVVAVEADLMEIDAAETDMMDGHWKEEHPYTPHLCVFVVVDSVVVDFENKCDTLD